MNDVFISYKVHNRKIAIDYYYQLKSLGLSVWFDQLIPPNASWDKAIARHIKQCSIVVCLLSKDVLRDDWVEQQIMLARKYHKKIIYIALETLDLKQFKRFNVEKCYSSLNEIDWSKVIDNQEPLTIYRSYKKEMRRGQLIGYFLVGLLWVFSIYLFCYGLNFFHLHLNSNYGYLYLGLSIYIIFSYIPYRSCFIINQLYALGLLGICIYIYPPYFLSNIPVNCILFLLISIACSYIRFFKWQGFGNFILDFFSVIFIFISIVAMILLSQNLWRYDITYLAIPIVLVYYGLLYWKRQSFFIMYRNYIDFRKKYLKQGNNIFEFK